MVNLQDTAHQITVLTALANHELRGRDAILRGRGAGKFAGRAGRIDGVIPDYNHGLLISVMVYAVGTKRVLNGKPKTRRYWPLSEIEILPPQPQGGCHERNA